MKNLLLSLAFVLLCGTQAHAIDYYLSTTGSDLATGTSASTPWGTVRGALTNIIGLHGYAGAGHRLLVRTGTYESSGLTNTVNGSVPTTHLVPSGSGNATGSGNNGTWVGAVPFKIHAYPGDCSVNTCETVVFVRGLNPGYTAKTIEQLQGPNCGVGNAQDCVGVPTIDECHAASVVGNNPVDCWYGGGRPSGPGLAVPCDRSLGGGCQASGGGIVRSGGVINMDFFCDSCYNAMPLSRYVEFDGISFDGRGFVQSIFTIASRYSSLDPNARPGNGQGALMAKFWRFKNGEFRNSAGSCWASPSTYDRDEFGAENTSDMEFINFKIHHCGVPYNTYVWPGTGVNARMHPDSAFLHGWYGHNGQNLCDNCESYSNSGQGLAPEGKNNIIRNSYIHDNAAFGIQVNGPGWLIENNLFYNNGRAELQVRNSQNSVFRNNTFVWGAQNVPGVGIRIDGTAFGGVYENNLIEGFISGITNSVCGSSSAPCFYADFPPVIRKNAIRSPSGPSFEVRNIVSPVVSPVFTAGPSNQDPLFVNPGGLDFRIQSGSPAKDAGFNTVSPTPLTRDRLGNVRPINGIIDIGAYEYCVSGCNTAPTTATISVLSANHPGAANVSVSWTVSGGTCNLSSPQSTTFNLTCSLGSTVVFTAPATGGDATFASWLGCPSSLARVCTVSVTAGATITANFGSVRTLTLTTLNPTTSILPTFRLSPADDGPTPLLGLGTCTAMPCQRRYNNTQSLTVVFPPIIYPYVEGASYFDSYNGTCPTPSSVPNVGKCELVMGQDRTVTATYGGNGCRIKKDMNLPPWNSPVGLSVTLCDGPIDIFICPTSSVLCTKEGSQPSGATGTIVTDSTYSTPYHYDDDSEYFKVDFAGAAPSGTAPNKVNPDGWMLPYTMIPNLGPQPVNTAITTKPASLTTSTTGTFEFTGSGGTAPRTFECSLDGASFSTCTTPKAHTSLPLGSHTFQVRAVDSLAVVDLSPDSYTWTIVAALPPTVVIDSGPTQPISTSLSATFAWTASSCTGCTFQCHIDGATPSPCTSGQTFTTTPGNHTFYVGAFNSSGGQSSEASYAWQISLPGSGDLVVDACVQMIAGQELNVNAAWPTVNGQSATGLLGSQPPLAVGKIVQTSAITNAQGRTGVRINWLLPLTFNNAPKNSDTDSTTEPDGWSSSNAANFQVISCPNTPFFPTGTTVKVGAATINIGSGTVKQGVQ